MHQAFRTPSVSAKCDSSLGGHAEGAGLCLQDRGVDPVAVDAAPPPPAAAAPAAPVFGVLAAPGAHAAPRQARSTMVPLAA